MKTVFEEHDELFAIAATLYAEDAVLEQEEAAIVGKIPGMAHDALRRLRERSLERKRARRAGIAKQLDELEVRYGSILSKAPELRPVDTERGRIIVGKLAGARMTLARIEKSITGAFADNYRQLQARELRDEIEHLERLLRVVETDADGEIE